LKLEGPFLAVREFFLAKNTSSEVFRFASKKNLTFWHVKKFYGECHAK